MRFTSDKQRKAVFAKRGRVIAHIGAPSGAGKTTLGNRLAKRFPNVTVKDLDDFRGVSFKEQPSANYVEPGLRQRYQRWLSRQKKPVVLVGFERMQTAQRRRDPLPPADMQIPDSARRYLLNTWPLTNTYRMQKRAGWVDLKRWKQGPREGLRGLGYIGKDYQLIRKDRRQYKRLGYQKMSANRIERAIGKRLKEHS